MNAKKPVAATVLTWLRANQGPRSLAGLTSTDVRALLASVQIVECWSRYDTDGGEIAKAWGAIVRQMQPGMRQFAFHAVAHVLDWNDRFIMWRAAGFTEPMPSPCYRCKYEPQSRSAEAASAS